jgi:hypothetical protein
VELDHGFDELALVGVADQAAVVVVVAELERADARGVEAQAAEAAGQAVEVLVVAADQRLVVVERDPGDRGADDVVGGQEREREGDVELLLAELDDQLEQLQPGPVVVGAPAGGLEVGDSIRVETRVGGWGLRDEGRTGWGAATAAAAYRRVLLMSIDRLAGRCLPAW